MTGLDKDLTPLLIKRIVLLMETEQMGKAWQTLMDMGVSDDTIHVVVNINGYTYQTLCDILYVTHGYRNFDQIEG